MVNPGDILSLCPTDQWIALDNFDDNVKEDTELFNVDFEKIKHGKNKKSNIQIEKNSSILVFNLISQSHACSSAALFFFQFNSIFPYQKIFYLMRRKKFNLA